MTVASSNPEQGLRIAFCHLESLVGLPAVNRLFEDFGDKIGLVILSQRFGAGNRGIVSQFLAGVRRSGVAMTLWLGFDIVAARVVGALAAVVPRAGGRRPALQTVRALAQHRGAQILYSSDVNADSTIAAVRAYEPDVVVVMNFDQILRPPFLAVPRKAVLNVHPSLLPALRGPCPAFWALVDGSPSSGATIHLIDSAEIDAGPIVAQRRRKIGREISVAQLTAELYDDGASLLSEPVARLMHCGVDGVSQDVESGSYRGFPNREDMSTARTRRVRLVGVRYVLSLIFQALFAGRRDSPQER